MQATFDLVWSFCTLSQRHIRHVFFSQAFAELVVKSLENDVCMQGHRLLLVVDPVLIKVIFKLNSLIELEEIASNIVALDVAQITIPTHFPI